MFKNETLLITLYFQVRLILSALTIRINEPLEMLDTHLFLYSFLRESFAKLCVCFLQGFRRCLALFFQNLE